ncbi:heparan-alpha-glucosaminide N-acetyltransferase domain-containing protein [Sinomonas sp.]|uniref:heparan-alpha-glucosaminide N-acetyltransferase domain-containing protein n=1 Tax=Sinomonas sp. TaxID=1914986 RepID=UPI002FE187C7
MHSVSRGAPAGGQAESGSGPLAPRDTRIDRLRGVLVLLMVGGDYLAGVQFVPAFLKHAPDIGLTVADLVAPCFILVIGLNYGPSFERRSRQSLPDAYRHLLTRYLGLLGIGAIITAGGTVVAGQPTDWGVLQALGMAGLVAAPFVRLGTPARFAVGILILGAYQYLLNHGMLQSVLSSTHGGFLGSLAWGGLLVLSTAVADVWRKGHGPYAACCGVLAVVAAASLLIAPVSKNRVSLSYVLITLAVSALALLVTDVLSSGLAARAGYFCWWGENALALYLAHLLLLGLIELPASPQWYSVAPVWLAVLQLAALLAVTSLVAWWLHRRRIRIGL